MGTVSQGNRKMTTVENDEAKAFQRTDEDVILNRPILLFIDSKGLEHTVKLLPITRVENWLQKTEDVADLQEDLNESVELMQGAEQRYQALRTERTRLKIEAQNVGELVLADKERRLEGKSTLADRLDEYIDDDLRAKFNPEEAREVVSELVRRVVADTEQPTTDDDVHQAREAFKTTRTQYRERMRLYLDAVFEAVVAYSPETLNAKDLRATVAENQVIHAFLRLRMFSNPLAEENAISAKFAHKFAEMLAEINAPKD